MSGWQRDQHIATLRSRVTAAPCVSRGMCPATAWARGEQVMFSNNNSIPVCSEMLQGTQLLEVVSQRVLLGKSAFPVSVTER